MQSYRDRYEVPVMDEIERIERRISLHDLRVLMAVVDTGSMGKAARLLATSQPAVSRSVGELEQALGVRLLDRSARGIGPTPYGHALVRRGAAVFDEIQQGIKDVQAISNPAAGTLTLGASLAIAEGLVCSVIRRLFQRYPGLRFHVHAADTATAYQDLLARKIDLAVVHLIQPPDEKLVIAEPLLQDPHVVVVGAHNPLSRRRRLLLSDLMTE